MKLNYQRTITVGLAFLAISAFWSLYDHVVPLMLQNTFGLPKGVTGIIMALDNVAAIVLLPVFGALSDRTITRWGRRMPYIICGCLASAAAMMLIPAADTLVSLPLFVIGLGLTLLLMSVWRSPAVALMPDVTLRPLRSKGNAIINLMGTAGGIIILVLTSIMLPSESSGQKVSYLPIYFCLLAIMVLCALVLLLRVREPRFVSEMQTDAVRYGVQDEIEEKTDTKATKAPLAAPVRRSMGFMLASIALWFMGYNAVTTFFSTYCLEKFGIEAGGSAMILTIAQVAAIITYIPVGIVATRIGRKKTILGGVVMLAVAFGLGGTFNSLGLMMYGMFVLAGIAWASINVNSYPMVVEMAHGGDVGRFTGYYYMASMAAQIATPTLAGWLQDWFGYGVLFPYGSLFVALSFLTMLFVHHGDAKPVGPKSKLEAFEALDD